jgi:hypothetical protein
MTAAVQEASLRGQIAATLELIEVDAGRARESINRRPCSRAAPTTETRA